MSQVDEKGQGWLAEPDVIIYDVGQGPLTSTFQSYCVAHLAPLLILTTTWDIAWQAIEAGAGDAMMTPCDPAELLFRARRLVHASQMVRVHYLVIDLKNRHVRLGNQVPDLSPLELRLLICLAEHVGEAVSFDQILDEAWECPSNRGGTREQVKTLVKRLRRKIERDPGKPQYLVSVQAVGYRLRSQAQWDEEVSDQA